MPSLLSPAFLIGLVVVAVPILVHLRMRERRTSQPFPSLMFVRRIPHKSLRRRTLQNLLLFAARTLVVVLLCFAFARPFFPVEAGGAAPPAGPLGRIVALDVSASMGYEGVFPRARAEAEQAIRELGPADVVGVLLFSDQAQGVVPPSTDHAKAMAAVRAAAPGVRSTRFAPALRLASDWLAALKVDRREVILVTDGQARALTGMADVTMSAGASVAVRSVAPADPDNASITEATLEHSREEGRGFAIVTARVVHQGREPRSVSATLEVAGRVVEAKTVDLPQNGAASVTFVRTPLPQGASKGRVVLKSDRLIVDDTFHFVLGAGADLPVLLIDSSPYVVRALEIGDRPSFDIVRRKTLVASDLAGRSLVVLGDLGPGGLTPPASQALARFVREGGGLLATTPLAGLRGEAMGLLPGSWGETVSRLADRGASIGFVDLDHPALLAFKQARGSDFSRARFLQYRVLRPEAGPEGEGLRVLARFDDGREALVEASFGLGRVVAFTSPLDGLMSDLPVQPLFLPLIHELARYASAHRETPLYQSIGSSIDIAGRTESGVEDPPVSVVLPSGRREKIAEGSSGIELQAVGFHEAIRASGARSVTAANVDSAESDLTALEPDELEAAVRPTGSSVGTPVTPSGEEQGARQSWWRMALLSVALLTLFETLFGNTKGPRGDPLIDSSSP